MFASWQDSYEEQDHKEGGVMKNWYLPTMVLEKTCEESLGQQGNWNQSILREINAEYSLERLMLKLKLQYFGHLMQIANFLEKTVMLVKTEGRRGWQRMRRLDGITGSMDMNLGKIQEMLRDREAWHVAVHRVTKNQTQLGDWTTTNTLKDWRLLWTSI